MHRRVIGSETILVVAVIDGHFDGYGRVNQTNHSGRNANEVGVPAISGASESMALP